MILETREKEVYMFMCVLVYLEMVVYRQEVLLQRWRSAEAFPEVFDSQFGEMQV